MEKYINYDCLDFAADEYFLQWVKHPDIENTSFWNLYLSKYPVKKAAVNEAVTLINNINAPSRFSDDEKLELWRTIESKLPSAKVERIDYRYRYVAAACIAILLLSSLFFLKENTNNTLVNLQTGYAQKRSVILPDGSTVILNANSKLTYPQSFAENKVREVWVSGEAYFNIRHINKNPQQVKTNERFIVHANNMNIEVLGTRFNVYRRHTDTRVSLLQGKVQVSFTNLPGKLTMKPGELVAYGTANKKYNKIISDVNSSALWVSNKISLSNTPLSDIKNILQDNYGVTVKYEDESLSSEKLSGEIPSNNLDIITRALSAALGKSITKNGNTLIIHK